ncbi:MAG: helix-turn-helix transcriptional regulator [Patescibacteria group bacterium]
MASNKIGKSRKELGEKLRRVREQSGLTQAEVAEKADLHVNYYARIERGEENPSFEKLQGIMKALKIKSLDLL